MRRRSLKKESLELRIPKFSEIFDSPCMFDDKLIARTPRSGKGMRRVVFFPQKSSGELKKEGSGSFVFYSKELVSKSMKILSAMQQKQMLSQRKGVYTSRASRLERKRQVGKDSEPQPLALNCLITSAILHRPSPIRPALKSSCEYRILPKSTARQRYNSRENSQRRRVNPEKIEPIQPWLEKAENVMDWV